MLAKKITIQEEKQNENGTVASWLPLYHDMGLIAGFLLPVLKCLPLGLLSPFDWVKAPYKLFQAISRYRGTLYWMPNFAAIFALKRSVIVIYSRLLYPA